MPFVEGSIDEWRDGWIKTLPLTNTWKLMFLLSFDLPLFLSPSWSLSIFHSIHLVCWTLTEYFFCFFFFFSVSCLLLAVPLQAVYFKDSVSVTVSHTNDLDYSRALFDKQIREFLCDFVMIPRRLQTTQKHHDIVSFVTFFKPVHSTWHTFLFFSITPLLFWVVLFYVWIQE